MNDPMLKDLYAKSIGDLILMYYESLSPSAVFQQAERNAFSLISEIRDILNDETLSDPDCFEQIDAIVTAFYQAGLSTSRHQEVE